RSQVVDGEFGGITQHIGAYQVKTPKGEIVFLDTPGHEAFTAMRARGVQATDIVVLVVAADDGVMPQTIESINHAKAAGVPIIVAINKIDMPQARPERVRTELMQHQILSTQLGGDTEFVEISAKKGLNMEALLEIILLQAEVLELKANPNRPAEGIVIESHIDNLRGAVATVLVQRGTLKVGQYFVVGQQYGRVRAMLDDHGRTIEQSTLAQPVELIGLTGTPEVGETLLVMDDERKAREIAERRLERRRMKELSTSRPITLEGIHDMIAEGKIKELNVILKADVQGSVEAISQSLEKLSNDPVRVRILHTGTGSVTENDVNLALASEAIIIGFNVRPEPGASDLAARVKVDIKSYRIIYELLEDVEKALVGMLDKQYTEQIQGRAEVRDLFRISKVGVVAGCMIASGEVHRNSKARLVRDGKVIYDGKIDSLRRHKDDASKVAAGYECGIMLERFQDVKVCDIIETYTMQEVPVELTKSQS
ncbi:translation initiation factor IF-2, partial [bacterium]|nr:translation initiation factor IF-2 [bacterium]